MLEGTKIFSFKRTAHRVLSFRSKFSGWNKALLIIMILHRNENLTTLVFLIEWRLMYEILGFIKATSSRYSFWFWLLIRLFLFERLAILSVQIVPSCLFIHYMILLNMIKRLLEAWSTVNKFMHIVSLWEKVKKKIEGRYEVHINDNENKI